MFIVSSSLKSNASVSIIGSLSDEWVINVFNDFDYNIEQLNFDLAFKKNGEFVEVKGNYKAKLKLTCVRCVKDFDFDMNNDFTDYLYQENVKVEQSDLELKADDLQFSFLEKDEIYPAQIVREQILLTLPDYPVCNAECHCNYCEFDEKDITCNKENPFTKLNNLDL
jgi:uncharacterized protein